MDNQVANACRGCLGVVNSDGVSLISEGVRQLYEKCTYISLPDPSKDTLSHFICSECYIKCQSWLLFKTICNDNELQLCTEARDEDDVLVPDEKILVLEEKSVGMLYPIDGSMEEIKLTIDEDDEHDEDSASVDEATVDVWRQLEESHDRQKSTITVSDTKENTQMYADSSACPVCCLLFSDPFELNAHLKGHLSAEDPKCPVCDVKFTRTSKALAHILKLHFPDNQPPPRKRKRISEESSYINNEGPLDISEDNGISMSSPEESLIQLQTGQDKKIFLCPICEEFFTNNRNLSLHLRQQHIKEGDSQCPICPAIMKNIHGVIIHIFLTHTNKWNCSVCHVRLDSLALYVAHVREHKQIPSPPWHCRACLNLRYDNYAGYRSHLEGVHWRLAHTCPYCDVKIRTVEEFVGHIVKAHTPGKWDCTHCAIGFDRKDHFDHHVKNSHYFSGDNEINTHGGELRCPWCPELHFTDYAHFKSHIFSKHVEGHVDSIDCGECQKPLLDGMDLMDHLLETHLTCTLGCGNCEFQCTRASEMERHLDEVHKIGKTSCTICGREVRLMKEHMRKHEPTPNAAVTNKKLSISVQIRNRPISGGEEIRDHPRGLQREYKCI